MMSEIFEFDISKADWEFCTLQKAEEKLEDVLSKSSKISQEGSWIKQIKLGETYINFVIDTVAGKAYWIVREYTND